MSFLSDLLTHYQITTKDLGKRNQPGSFNLIETPYNDEKFLLVISRLKQAIERREKVVIYGDYDVDGLTSTCIIKRVLDEFNLNCGFFIPSRYKEGYGLNSERVKEFNEKGYNLIICVDNGVSQVDSINLAYSLGMEVVIIDHHEIPSLQAIKTPYLFHYETSKFISYSCSACSLAFFVASYLRNRMDEYDATLAGLAVFGDVMPLIGNNLQFVKLALQFINNNHYVNFNLLTNKEIYTYDDLSISINSALNSVNRVCKDSLSTNNACKFLLSYNDKDKAYKYSQGILHAVSLKKEIKKTVTFSDKFESSNSLSLIASDYVGMVGLYASQMLDEHKKNTAVFSSNPSNSDELTGSIRMKDNFNIVPFLEENKNLFVSYGGHEKACGVTLKRKNYYQFITLFASECEKQFLNLEKKMEDYIPICIEDLNQNNYDIYQMFMPFGEGFAKPKFSISFAKNSLIKSKNGNALFVYNKPGKISIFKDIDKFLNFDKEIITIVGSLNKNIFNGTTSYEIIFEKFLDEI